MTRLLVGAIVAFGLLCSSFVAQAAETKTLGRTILLEHINNGAEIPLIICRYTDAIQIRAERDLRLEKAIVTFRNGETRTIQFHRKLKKGESTDWRKFAYRRCVKHIEVFGEAKNGTAGIKVMGRGRDKGDNDDD